MNNAKQVAKLVEELAPQVLSGVVSISEAGWQIAIACVGWPYVFGAWGAECTVAERKKRYNAHPSHTTIKTACKAFDGGTCSGCKWYPDGERVRCFDCRGFTDWVLKQIGFDLHGEGATSQWNTAANWAEKGAVADGIPQGVLVCLFYEDKDNPKTMAHTGLYFNGETCECSNNVQHFTKANKKWTKWAVPACFADGYQAPQKPAENAANKPVDNAVDKLEHPTLRRSDKGEKVREMQALLMDRGYDLGRCGVDGDYGSATEAAVRAFQKASGLKADGVCGPKTWAALLDSVKPKLYTVTISHLLASEADAIIKKYGGEKTEE